MLIRDGIPILLYKPFHLIRHVQSIVGNREGRVAKAWFLINLLKFRFAEKLTVQFLQERGVSASW